MKVLLGLALLLLSANAGVKPRYEFGIDQSVHWAREPYHVLQSGSALKREFKVPIRFMKPFPAAPAVVIAPIKLDWLEGLPVGFDIYVSQVSKAGFELTYVALTPNQINGFDIHWGAIYDPKIAVITKSYSGDAMKTLAENTRTNNNLDFTINYPETYKPKSKPNIAIFATGVQITTQFPYFLLEVLEPRTTLAAFTVRVNARQRNQIPYIAFNAIVGIPETIYVGGVITNWFPYATHPNNVIKPEQERLESFTSPITDPAFQKFPRFQFYGFNGFHYLQQGNMRAKIVNFQLLKQSLKFDVGTWQNSIVPVLQVSYFIYVPTPDESNSNVDCAQIFEECDYKGDSFIVCDRKMSFAKDGWNKPTKSFKVPVDKVLKVYQEENLEGKSIRIEKDTPCMQEVKFPQFIQLHDITDEFWDSD